MPISPPPSGQTTQSLQSATPLGDIPRLLHLGILLLALFALASVLRFVLAVYGSPVDDAYIFFAYARNLARGQGWSLNPDETSFGTSSPLWTLLLFFAASFGADPIQAARVLGAVFQAGSTAAMGYAMWYATRSPYFSLLAAGVVASAIPLLHIAASGMDASLHMFLLLLFLFCILRDRLAHPVFLGAVAGLAYLSRPDGIILLPVLTLVTLLTAGPEVRARPRTIVPILRPLLTAFAVAAVTVSPWMVFLLWKTSNLLPTSYYGKLYSMPGAPETLTYSLIQRCVVATTYLKTSLLTLAADSPFLSLPLILLVALSLTLLFWATLHKPDSPGLLPTVTGVLFSLLLFVGLPFEYAWSNSWWDGGYLHRYYLPALPFGMFLTLLAANGFLSCFERTLSCGGLVDSTNAIPRTPSRGVLGIVVLTPLLLALVGCLRSLPIEIRNYQILTGLNEEYRRTIAEWLRTNTGKDARIAEQRVGIGVLAYYGDRYLLDGGGLVDPRIIEFWRTDGNPAASVSETVSYFRAMGAQYVIAGPELQAVFPEFIARKTWQHKSGVPTLDEQPFLTTVVYEMGTSNR